MHVKLGKIHAFGGYMYDYQFIKWVVKPQF